jgi:glycerol kinase
VVLSSSRRFIAAIDSGTTSTRCILFDRDGEAVSSAQVEHRQIFPQSGWVEHDPEELWRSTIHVLIAALAGGGIRYGDVAAIGITNQRETTIVWDRETGAPVCNAIVWQDTRTDELCRRFAGDLGMNRYQCKTGLPLSTYSSAPKIAWILDNVPGARARAERGELCFGTPDSWLIWKLTGGRDGVGGLHVTDVTNASRTLLMDLRTLQWDPELCAAFGVPVSMLPKIQPSSGLFGTTDASGPLPDVPVTGVLGDQHAALVGQACLHPGDVKNTYGTGNFILMNTGATPVFSENGLITTLAYQFEGAPPVYALEGSIAVTGSLVQWLRDNLGLFSSADEIEGMARSVPDNGGAYIVPAFSGLFAPRWRADARGVITGLTRFITKNHLARAALEAAAYQTREVVQAMVADSGTMLSSFKVDGGMVVNDLLMQFQADILDATVVRPRVIETTALGAAYAAGLAVGFFGGEEGITARWAEDKHWESRMPAAERAALVAGWNKAVERSYNWVD